MISSLHGRLALGAIVVACAIAAGMAVASRHGHSSTLSASVVARRALEQQSTMLATLGPNTTFHEVRIIRRSPAQAALDKAPADTRSEGWWFFDGTGKLSACYAATYDLATGKILVNRQTMSSDGTLTSTDYGSGTSHQIRDYNQLTASAVQANANTADATNESWLSAIGPGAAEFRGGDYVLAAPHERDYFDAVTFRLDKVEEYTPDGEYQQTSEITVSEVLQGNAMPTLAAGS